MKSITERIISISFVSLLLFGFGMFGFGILAGKFIFSSFDKTETVALPKEIIKVEEVVKVEEVEKEIEKVVVIEPIVDIIYSGVIVKQEFLEDYTYEYVTTIEGYKATTVTAGKQFKKVKERGQFTIFDEEIWFKTAVGDDISVLYTKKNGECILKSWTKWEE